MSTFHVGVRSHWVVECHKPDGSLRWRSEVSNLVTTVGKNYVLDATFKTGVASPAWYVGLVDGTSTPTYDAADTAGSHVGWTENTGYSNGTRPALTLGSIAGGSVNNSASKASFTISANDTIAGGFLSTLSTKG